MQNIFQQQERNACAKLLKIVEWNSPNLDISIFHNSSEEIDGKNWVKFVAMQ